ncbi:hypothetical protein CDAR_224481 [Caerostris darwini]|uniref:Maturase K n=1 Tax=Caerostris darwini TaxID=1538125 RepID=A0AAV4WYY1_9ARAC|nr:hypothetical protein CDAR_224481 [Caerostris darwini]
MGRELVNCPSTEFLDVRKWSNFDYLLGFLPPSRPLIATIRRGTNAALPFSHLITNRRRFVVSNGIHLSSLVPLFYKRIIVWERPIHYFIRTLLFVSIRRTKIYLLPQRALPVILTTEGHFGSGSDHFIYSLTARYGLLYGCSNSREIIKGCRRK